MKDIVTDDFGYIINHEDNYWIIARILDEENRYLIGWTDEKETHFDILFTNTSEYYGNIEGGIRPKSYLFVSIMRIGAFAFDVNDENTTWVYYEDKLCYGREKFGETTGMAVAELINGVKRELRRFST